MGGLSCCLGAAALYLLGRSCGREAEILKLVPRFSQLRDLAMRLDTAIQALPLVTISGRVGSKTPIRCKHSRLRAVIVQETAEQHFLKRDDNGKWIRDSDLMAPRSKVVPWYLDDGTCRVYVVGALGATGLELTCASSIFEDSRRSLVPETLDYLENLIEGIIPALEYRDSKAFTKGRMMLGVGRGELVLPIGTSLTAVGEAVKDNNGRIRIRRPRNGPFYVSQNNIDQIIAILGMKARLYQWASKGLSVFGLFLIAKHAVRFWKENGEEICQKGFLLPLHKG